MAPLEFIRRLLGRAGHGPRVLLVRKQHDPTDDIYIQTPLTALAREGLLSLKVLNFAEGFGAGALGRADVLVISRYIHPRLLRLVQERAASFRRIVYLFDDDLLAASQSASLPEGYRQMIGEFAQTLFPQLLELAHTVVVTSPRLAERYASPRTRLLEPTLYRDLSRVGLEHFASLGGGRSGPLEVAYLGTTTHYGDLCAVAPGLRQFVEEQPAVRLTVVGCELPPALERHPRIRAIGQKPWGEFKRFAAGFRTHLGLAPLLDTPWNQGKTAIKLIEYAQYGAAALYSAVPPYRGLIEEGAQGWLVENEPEAWRRRLGELVARPEELRAGAERAQAFAALVANPERARRFWRELLELA